MGRYNLLEENWISVIVDNKGNSELVSLKMLFRNAHLYIDLAGDTKTQDFAVLRVLLAVIYTVFSRLDCDGNEYCKLDDKFMQIEKIDEEDLFEYKDLLYNNWVEMWNRGKFPDIIDTYLDKWKDRFNLFDDKYPFFQAVKKDVENVIDFKKSNGNFFGKNINRTISESNNKIALFSPKYESDDNKEKLSEAEIARWLLTLHGYIGTGDKKKLQESVTYSKGWLYDIGGIYIKGENIFETLMLNYNPIVEEKNNLLNIQKPCWEYESCDVLKSYYESNQINNISRLYTAWSRAIVIDSEYVANTPFKAHVVKIPEIDHKNNFLEQMTIWKNDDYYLPKKHILNQSIWRSFGLIATPSHSEQLENPGVIKWLKEISKKIGDRKISICCASMQDDGNATSWAPIDEIYDSLRLSDYVLTDFGENGWIDNINSSIDTTKEVVSKIYKTFIINVKEIRNINSDLFVKQNEEYLYFKIDMLFRQWLEGISINDNKNEKMLEWKKILLENVKMQAEEIIKQSGTRDYIGVVKDDKMSNIAISYNIFNSRLHKLLNEGGHNSGGKQKK